jgi:hypothetical protein
LPPEYLQRFLEEDESLPVPDAVFGFDEDAEGEGPVEIPSFEELLEDPDVKTALEAAKGLEPVAA